MSVGEFVDRGTQIDAAELVTIGGKVGASAGQLKRKGARARTLKTSGIAMENPSVAWLLSGH
jgi:hypothetical protein